MNKEYMHLSDNDVIITNEEGRIVKRNFDNNINVNKFLLNENKLEIIGKKLEYLEYELDGNKKIVWFCKKMCQVQPLIILITSLLGFLSGGIATSFALYGLLCSIIGGIVGTIISSAGIIYLMISKSKANKKILAIKSSIEELEKLKEKTKKELKELSRAKEKEINYEINKSISLNNSTKVEKEKIENSISETYENTLKSKKLVLRKYK